MDWTGRLQDRERWRDLVNEVTNTWGPKNVGNFFTSRAIVSFVRQTLLCGVSQVFFVLNKQ